MRFLLRDHTALPWLGSLLLAATLIFAGCGGEVINRGDDDGGGASSGAGASSGTGAAAGTGGAGTGGTPSAGGSSGVGGDGAAPGYPPGPYGTSEGDVIADYTFTGMLNAVDLELVEISLSDFYNPSGDANYPPGSPLGPGPKPQGLLLNVAVMWAPPSNYETTEVLPGLYATYAPQGAEFLQFLAEGNTPAQAADLNHLLNWVTSIGNPLPTVIDPMAPTFSNQLMLEAYPSNMVIDTTTMVIQSVEFGVLSANGEAALQQTLN